jgi:hypothetical protein
MAVFEGYATKTTVEVALCVCVQVSSVGVYSVLYSAAFHELHILAFLTWKECICMCATSVVVNGDRVVCQYTEII